MELSKTTVDELMVDCKAPQDGKIAPGTIAMSVAPVVFSE